MLVLGSRLSDGANASLRFLAAPPAHGIAFQLHRQAVRSPHPGPRLCTPFLRPPHGLIARCGVAVEMIVHVMAALAGLQIDNCLVELDGPEPPGCDGSSLLFAERLFDAGIVDQGVPRERLELRHTVLVHGDNASQCVRGDPVDDGQLHISYTLDYGPSSPIAALQQYSAAVSPQTTVVAEIAFARTFLLEHERAGPARQGSTAGGRPPATS